MTKTSDDRQQVNAPLGKKSSMLIAAFAFVASSLPLTLPAYGLWRADRVLAQAEVLPPEGKMNCYRTGSMTACLAPSLEKSLVPVAGTLFALGLGLGARAGRGAYRNLRNGTEAKNPQPVQP